MNMVQQGPSGAQRDNSQRNNNDDYAAKVDQLMSEMRTESDALQRESTEIELLLRQTNSEVEKLANRELTITNRVRDMELNLDNYSRTDMKTIYNSAHEIQMRLFMMRAQVEQLEAKRNTMKTLQTRINRVTSVLSSAPEGYSPSGNPNKQRPASVSQLTPLPDSYEREVDNESRQVAVKVIEAQEDERLRVSRQIHDGPAQTMTNLVLRAEICERLLDMDLTRARTELSGLKSAVNNTLQETRRFIFDLRPMILDDLGLEPTLRRFVQQFAEKYKIEGGVTVNGMNGRLPLPMEVALFRIVQEALSNVSKHAHANHAQVTIEVNAEDLVVSVEDDGLGFNIDEPKVQDSKKVGLPSMRQRAEMFGGRLNVESAPGRGTRIVVTMPVDGSI